MNSMDGQKKVLKILALSGGDTVSFALSELEKYLGLMDETEVRVLHRICYDESERGIWIGKTGKFPQIALPDKLDDKFDDFVFIDVAEGCGIIAGNNRRSILLAVYRFLAELGCRWVRPGKDGELIPRTDYCSRIVKAAEMPSYRYRAIVIEGSVSLEHGFDLVDWLPKAGFNGFMIPFKDAFEFFERWYRHHENPLKEPETFTPEMGEDYTKRLIGEIKKRGLIYHAVGHGWGNVPLGLFNEHSLTGKYSRIEGIEQYLAMTEGKRRIWDNWGKNPNNTHLCYSNPQVRSFMVESVLDYVEEHTEVDLLHFWLADGRHNYCECENCRKASPSDFYVLLMNELDERLTEKGLDLKLVFLNYEDLMWTPAIEKIKNPDRYILMFAPITRTYSSSITADMKLPEVWQYELNKSRMPVSVEENFAYLREWQRFFKGDSFIFEYHMWYEHYKDPGNMQIAGVLYEDMKNIRDLGLNGQIAVTSIRPFLPNGLGMTVMGRTLWDRELELSDIEQDYFTAAYGEDRLKCLEYLKKLSELFNPPYLRRELPPIDAGTSRVFGSIPAFIDSFTPVIEKNLTLDNHCHAKSWEYLRQHAVVASSFAGVLEAFAGGDSDLSDSRWARLKTLMCEKEDELYHVFDVYMVIRWVGHILDGLKNSISK